MNFIENHRFSVSANLVSFVTIFHLFLYGNVNGQECSPSCTSASCMDISSNFLRKLQSDVDPCDDFYGYVCGKYPENTYIAEGIGLLPDIQSANFQMYDRLLKILEAEPGRYPGSISANRKIIHDSCVKFRDTEKEIENFVTWLSANVFSGWPYLNSTSNHANVSEWLTKLYLFREFSFFTLNIEYQTAEMYMQHFDMDNRGLPEDFVERFVITFRPKYFLLLDYCPDVDRTRFVDFLYDLLEAIRVPLVKSKEIVNDAIKIDDFIRNAPEYYASTQNTNSEQAFPDCKVQTEENRWCDILNMIAEITKVDLSNATFKLSQPEYFDFIDKTLRQKPKRAIANYLAIRFLVNNLKSLQIFSPFLILPCRTQVKLPGQFPDINFSLDKRTNCLTLFTSYMPGVIVKDYMLDAEVEAKLAEMEILLEMLKYATASFINSSTWMDDEIKQNILHSVCNFHVGNKKYFDHIMKNVDYAIRYTDLSPIEGNFAYNLLELKRIYILDKLKTYHLGYADDMYVETNLFFTEAYSGLDIMFGFGFFEAPYANLDRPLLMDLSILGTTFGHEISHELKEQFGHSAEFQGLIFNHTKAFKTCMLEKYSSFEIPQIKKKVDSEHTFAEDFANMLGMQLTYQVYKSIASGDSSIHHKLPATNLSDKQMFFVSYGQQWCQFGDKRDYNLYLGEVHRPSMHRVNGPLRNFDAFVKAFHCPVGSNMNSGSDCKL